MFTNYCRVSSAGTILSVNLQARWDQYFDPCNLVLANVLCFCCAARAKLDGFQKSDDVDDVDRNAARKQSQTRQWAVIYTLTH